VIRVIVRDDHALDLIGPASGCLNGAQ